MTQIHPNIPNALAKPESSILYRLGFIIIRFRWIIILAWISAFLLALPLLPQIVSQLKGGFGVANTESREALTILEEKFDVSESSLIVVFSNDQLTTYDPEYKAAMDTIMDPLKDRPEIRDIVTPFDGGSQDMVSSDGHTTYAIVSLNQSIDQAIDSFPDLERSLGKGNLQVWTTGGVPIFSDINRASEKDLQRGEMLAIPLVLIALLVVFRTVIAACVPVIIGAVSLSVSLALLLFMAHLIDVSIFALNIVSFLGLGIAIDYSLLVVSRFREESNKYPTDIAVARTLSTSGKTILFSGTTTILGLSSLLLFEFMMLRSLGLGGILVVLTSLTVTTTLLPAVLSVLGHKLNSFPILPSHNVNHTYWGKLALTVMKRPLLVAIPIMAMLLTLGIPFLNVNLGVPWASVLPESASSRQGWEIISEKIGPGEISPILIVVQSNTEPLDSKSLLRLNPLLNSLNADPRVKRVENMSVGNSLKGPEDPPEQETSNTMSKEVLGDTTVIRVVGTDSPVSEKSRELVRKIRSYDPPDDLNLLVTGTTADLMDSIELMYSDFPKAIIFVLLTVYVALLILFRSIFLPLKASLMNLMSIFASYGALVFIFQQGHFQNMLGFTSNGVTEATLPILLFAIIFGLSMDYEIFLLSRVKEFYDETGDNMSSVAKGIAATGPIITSAALILVLVSLSFASADIIIVKALGIGTAIAIFLDATIVRAFLVPALMKIMNHWNWWAPSFLKASPTDK